MQILLSLHAFHKNALQLLKTQMNYATVIFYLFILLLYLFLIMTFDIQQGKHLCTAFWGPTFPAIFKLLLNYYCFSYKFICANKYIKLRYPLYFPTACHFNTYI